LKDTTERDVDFNDMCVTVVLEARLV